MKTLRLAILMAACVVLDHAHAADVANGKRLAEQWCAPCHLVSPNQARGTADVPPFEAIARQPGFNAGQLALFLLDPHPAMPNMGLTRSEATDLAAYIQTLAARR